VLRRELRSLIPDLPVGQYVPPTALPGTAQPVQAQAQQQQQQPGAAVGGKPALLESGAAAGAALDRLRALRREGERLAEEGAGMDR
jgi:hypothetical protein